MDWKTKTKHMTYQEKFQEIKSIYIKSFDMDFYANSIINLIQEIRTEKNISNKTLVRNILLDWSNEIGCVDDGEICEKSLGKLYQNGFITKEELKLFWENTNYRQG